MHFKCFIVRETQKKKQYKTNVEIIKSKALGCILVCLCELINRDLETIADEHLNFVIFNVN